MGGRNAGKFVDCAGFERYGLFTHYFSMLSEYRRERSYVRKATLDNWVQAALIFAYPFHPLEGKREQIFAGLDRRIPPVQLIWKRKKLLSCLANVQYLETKAENISFSLADIRLHRP